MLQHEKWLCSSSGEIILRNYGERWNLIFHSCSLLSGSRNKQLTNWANIPTRPLIIIMQHVIFRLAIEPAGALGSRDELDGGRHGRTVRPRPPRRRRGARSTRITKWLSLGLITIVKTEQQARPDCGPHPSFLRQSEWGKLIRKLNRNLPFKRAQNP